MRRGGPSGPPFFVGLGRNSIIRRAKPSVGFAATSPREEEREGLQLHAFLWAEERRKSQICSPLPLGGGGSRRLTEGAPWQQV